MAEVLATASAITGLLSLMGEVYKVGAKYVKNVRHASKAVQDLLQELKAL